MAKCVICKKQRLVGTGTFFRVPKDDGKRRRWSEVCDMNFGKSAIICESHFAPDQFIKMKHKAVLLENALPLVHQVHETNNFQANQINLQTMPLYTPIEDALKQDDDNLFTEQTLTLEARKTSFSISEEPHNLQVTQTEHQPPEQSNACNSGTSGQNKKNSNPGLFTWEQLRKISAAPRKNNNSIGQRKMFSENHDKVLKSSVNFIPPQLEEPVVQMPAIKKVFCAGLTQTNVRLCGLVEASDVEDEFRFSCFYCNHVFPLDKWKNFVNHLKEKHSKEEEAFKTSKYLSKEHDYTPISLPPPYPVKVEPINFDVEPINSSLIDPLGSVQNPFESVVFNNNLSYTPYKSEISSSERQTKDSFIRFRQKSKYSFKKKSKRKVKKVPSSRFYSKLSKKHSSQRSALSRCLKRTIEAELKPSPELPETDESYGADSIVPASVIPTEIAFDYTPRPVINLLLDSMKIFPVLWQFDSQPFNEDFFEAAEDLCNTINNKFSLNIDNLKMRRSINRILRFFCSIYPNENKDPLTYYYDKCATFLSPASEIAYARCSHCYACFANDFELKLHLDEEQKYLGWPYKCPQCKECFRLWDEFELHKYLPHYAETFRCQPCELSFFHRSGYKKHLIEEHQSTKDAEDFKCDLCDKVLQSVHGLRWHKKTHGTRPHKCNLCPRAFHDKSKLEVHLKIHRQQYDFMCEVCGKKFIIQPALNIHMAKHTGEKVTCKICNLRLRKSSLSRHLKVVHIAHAEPINTNIFNGKVISLGKLLNSTRPRRRVKREVAGERHYKCKTCKVTFDNLKLIVEHNKELHSDCPKFSCKMCTSELRSKLNLKTHYRKKHKWHPFQVYKFLEEKASLEEVLSLDLKNMNEIYDKIKQLKNNLQNKKPLDNKSPIKTDLLPDETYFTDENIPSSTIQDEIMKVDIEVVGVETQDIKIDYMNDMLLTEFLEEE